MLEYRMKAMSPGKAFYNAYQSNDEILGDSFIYWREMNPDFPLDKLDFSYYEIRIDGKVYRHNSKQFIKAFKQARIFAKLKQ